MLTIEKCRKLLGEEEKLYDDQQILQLLDVLDLLAEIAIETYHNERENKTESGIDESR